MKNRILSMTLCLLLVIAALPLAFAGAEAQPGGYRERQISLPEGYTTMTAPTAAPDGSMVIAAKRQDDGTWDLLVYSDDLEAPRTMPLLLNGGSIAAIDFAADGNLMAMLSNMPPMEPGAGSGPVLMQGGDGPATEGPTDGPVIMQGGGPATEGPTDGPVMMQSGGPATEGPTDGPVIMQGGDVSMTDGPGLSQGGDTVQAQGNGQPRRMIFNADDMKTAIAWFGQDGAELARMELPGMLLGCVALPGMRVAAMGLDSGIVCYDADGRPGWRIENNAIEAMCASDEALYLLADGALLEYDPETGKERGASAVSIPQSAQMCAAADQVYMVSDIGIWRKGAADPDFIKLADGAGFVFGDPEQNMAGACVLTDGTLRVLMATGGMQSSLSRGGSRAFSINSDAMRVEGSLLMSYQYDESLDLSDRTDFVITALRSSAKLRKAVSDFQRAHPELNVVLQTSLAEDDEETPTEDAIRTLNTNLLAGKGGDVIAMDGMPMSKYIEKGVLIPLDELLPKLDLLPGILNGSRAADGHVYVIPSQFRLYTLWGDQSIVKLSSLAELAALSQTPLSARRASDWLSDLFAECAADFVGESGQLRFNTPEFESFLELCYQLYTGQVDSVDARPEGGAAGAPDLAAFSAIKSGAISLFDSVIGGTMQPAFGYTAAGADDHVDVAMMPAMSGPGRSYAPSLLLGVSSLSNQQQLAMEFIELVNSLANQAIDQMDGLPTSKSALDKLFDEAKQRNTGSREQMMVMMVSDGTDTFEIKQPGDAQWDALRALCDELTVPYIQDDTLMGFMVEESAAFFEGRATAQQTAEAIERRAMAYLNE